MIEFNKSFAASRKYPPVVKNMFTLGWSDQSNYSCEQSPGIVLIPHFQVPVISAIHNCVLKIHMIYRNWCSWKININRSLIHHFSHDSIDAARVILSLETETHVELSNPNRVGLFFEVDIFFLFPNKLLFVWIRSNRDRRVSWMKATRVHRNLLYSGGIR